jgi:PilZ domain
MSAVIERLADRDRGGGRRQRCLRQARCVFKRGYSNVEVTLRNSSELGALIEGPDLAWLPERFELHIHSGFGVYSRRPVRLVWSRGECAGLQFLDAYPFAV